MSNYSLTASCQYYCPINYYLTETFTFFEIDLIGCGISKTLRLELYIVNYIHMFDTQTYKISQVFSLNIQEKKHMSTQEMRSVY